MSSSPADRAAHAYVEAINANDLEALIALFAPDAEMIHPFGVYVGHDDLREFYGDMVLPAETRITVLRQVAEGPVAVIEIEARSPHAPEQPQHAVDLFEVDGQGRIAALRVYYRNFDLG